MAESMSNADKLRIEIEARDRTGVNYVSLTTHDARAIATNYNAALRALLSRLAENEDAGSKTP